MSESEKKTEWRDIWQEIIKISRDSLLQPNMAYPLFDDLEKRFPNDKMIFLEKAITAECLGDRQTARDFYQKSADEKNGLPVKHWRERAEYFLNRLEENFQCHTFGELRQNQSLRNVHLDAFFNIHSYFHLDNYIRYLGISSVSRITSEPAMAIVIFRTCLEIGLWTYFKETVEELNSDYKRRVYPKEWDIGLDDLLNEMNDQKIFKSNEYTAYNKIRLYGNEAAHPGLLNEKIKPFHYDNDELIKILNYFNQTMQFLNERAMKRSIVSN